MVETYGEKKAGIGMNYKGQWGYHPLLITLANTGEVLYLVNRPGNRPSHENAALYLDRSISLCRRAGFRRVLLRGDTDFSQTTHLDHWHSDNVEFVFAMDAMTNLVELAENLPDSVWQPLQRSAKTPSKTSRTRAKRPKYKEQFVIEKKYQNKQLKKEFVAEFAYQPTACNRKYRMVVLKKQVSVSKGQLKLFDETPDFFYITNLPQKTSPARSIVKQANDRCDQENIIAQLKDMGALSAPLHDLASNEAYMATLAWNLKSWLGLSITEAGPPVAKEKRKADKHRLVRMGFRTFRQSLIHIPAQIINSGRRLILPPADLDASRGNPVPSPRVRLTPAAELTASSPRSRSPDASVPPPRPAPESPPPCPQTKHEHYPGNSPTDPPCAPTTPQCRDQPSLV